MYADPFSISDAVDKTRMLFERDTSNAVANARGRGQ